ncbi:MAG: peptidyl-prolyl cis-trans isomerase [Polyangiaceae bacterium]
MNIARCLLLGLGVVSGVGCGESRSGGSADVGSHPPSSAASAEVGARSNVVARVNGAGITEADVSLRLQNDSHEAGGKGEGRRQAVLEQLVTREILAQRAVELGLDKDPKYQEGLMRLEAQLAAYRRQELSELLYQHEAGRRTAVSDAEARGYFEKNEERIRTRVHVMQILRRSESAIIEARSAIERGKTFEEVAKEMFPGLPEGQRPWDLGFMAFYQVPGPWRETVYELKPGEKSGILRGPNERFWLIQLVETKRDEGLTFESVKEQVIADMRASGAIASREAVEKELRGKAKVEIVGGE